LPLYAGTVVPSPTSSDGFYSAGTAVQVTAQPAGGYSFSGWSGDVSGLSNPQTVVMSAPRIATAKFTNSALPVDLYLPNTTYTSGSATFQALNSITAQSGFTIEGSASVVFKAAIIRLEPGFRATAGTGGITFRAAN
jgi:hypothetical protein